MRALILAVVVAGCGPSEASFPSAMGKALCTYNKQCFAAEFGAAYSSLSDCVASAEQIWAISAPEPCTYKPKAAACFLKAAHKASKSCDDSDLYAIYDCEQIYDCPAGTFETGLL